MSGLSDGTRNLPVLKGMTFNSDVIVNGQLIRAGTTINFAVAAPKPLSDDVATEDQQRLPQRQGEWKGPYVAPNCSGQMSSPSSTVAACSGETPRCTEMDDTLRGKNGHATVAYLHMLALARQLERELAGSKPVSATPASSDEYWDITAISRDVLKREVTVYLGTNEAAEAFQKWLTDFMPKEAEADSDTRNA